MTTETLGVSTKSTAEAVTSPNMEVAEEVLLEGSFLIGLGRREVGGKVGKFFVVKIFLQTCSCCDYTTIVLKVVLTASHIAISLAPTNCFVRFLCHRPRMFKHVND